MTVDTALYLGTLDKTIPANSDQEAEGAANLRQIKTAANNSFPNVTGAVTATHAELSYSAGVTSAIQTQLNAEAATRASADALKAPLASPTFTGTVVLPATGSGATEAVRKDYADAQYASTASPTFTGTVTLPATGSGATEAVRKDYADGLAFATVLPAQPGNSNKFVATNGTTASWVAVVPPLFTYFNFGGF